MGECCIHCRGSVYRLGNGMLRCPRCAKTYSPRKVERQLKLAEAFCRDLTAREAARSLGLNYVTAKRFYDRVRRLLLADLERSYIDHREDVVEYDEYLYLDHAKRRDKKYIFDAHNFLTFDYGGKVYNILMPSLERYKSTFLSDGLDEVYYREFSRFLKIHRIAKLRSIDNTIVRFWEYFDQFMKKYKGVGRDSFIYYLKEAEFKFNYPPQSRCARIEALLFRDGGHTKAAPAKSPRR
ncbi:transposase [Hydrogenimonas sp.]